MADLLPPRKGHPRALYVLFFTEMWERFGYYLMVGIFFLYLVGSIVKGGKGFDNAHASDILGTYIALVYLAPFLGGLIADRYLGYRRAIILGGSLMALGYYGLALPGDNAMFISLGFIIVGNGFFKPNISTLLGNIYSSEELKPKKDIAYNIFYMGINIGAFICNFIAAILRNNFGWGYAFAAAGVGMTFGLIWFIIGMKHVKAGDVRKPLQKEDMPLSKLFGYVFIPAILAGILGWNMDLIVGHSVTGEKSDDAFLFACVPIIIFYLGLLFRASKEDKKGLGALLAFFAVSIVFWVIYNQNSTALTIWTDQYTDRTMPEAIAKVAKPLYLVQPITTDSATIGATNEYMVQRKITKDMAIKLDSSYYLWTDPKKKEQFPDTAYTVTFHSKSDNSYIGRGIFADREDERSTKQERKYSNNDTTVGKSLNIQSLDPYLKNLPKDQWPQKGGQLSLFSTELFQSVNPFFIVLLTPLIVVLFFGWLKRKGKEPATPTKIAIGMVVAGLSSLLMMFAIMSTNIYLNKTNMIWIISTYGIFTVGELLISPIGLSMVSKLSPPRLTALMMGAWFLVNAIAGKFSGMMASYWDKFTDKKQYFLILFVAAIAAAIVLFAMVKWLHRVLHEKTGVD